MTRRIVVFDHHRRAADYIENPVLAYTESYASSTAELVTEVLQYCGATRAVTIFESEALLAGITVDTNRFAVKTGVRTFEAASWLKRCGADTTRVKRYFQTDMEFKNEMEMYKSCKRYSIRTNNIARKVLGFKTPNEMVEKFFNKVA